ncbi:MAG TPA: hypothetical protein VK324_12570, partial [Tepidisphaeraceae bacterium]|nr:hypothetical protein [Tepidisphaeraceae bacterium]
MVATAPPARNFVPADLDVADVTRLAPLYHQLLARPLDSAADAERFLADFSELSAVVDEFGSRRYIDKSCHTDDPAVEKRFLQFVEQVEPTIKPLHFQLQRRFLASPAAKQLPADKRHAMLVRKWEADVRLFRDENVPI